MSQDEDERRRQEISMFAKLASGDTFHDVSALSEKTDDASMDSKAMFAAAANVEGGGTFCISSSPNVHKAVASSNLDAAVAALTDGDDPLKKLMDTKDPLEDEVNLRRAIPRQPTEPMPMYNEKVLLPRPLFFGPVLPPRVIKEARDIVADAMKELHLDLSKRPRLSQLPPHVRNVVGAIESFGYGIPIFPSDVKKGDADSYRGNEYVSTFQPVWGDVARAERERLLRIYRAGQPEEPSPPAGESTREETVKPTEPGQSTSGEVPSTVAQLRRTLPGEDQQKIAGSNSFPERASPTKQISKSLLLRSKSAPVAGAKAPPAPPMSENDQFLQWARGKPVSPARHSATGKPPSFKKTPPNEKELFSQWARGKSASPELDIVKTKSDSDTSADKDLFSKWAQGNVDESPVLTESKKVDTIDGTSSDVAMFSKWAQGGIDEAPAMETDEVSDGANEPSEAPSDSAVDKNQFSQWAQGGGASPASSPSQTNSKTVQETDPAQAEKDLFAKWATGESNSDPSRSSPESSGSDKGNSSGTTEDKPASSEQNMFSHWARAGQEDTGTGTAEESSVQKNAVQRPFDTFCAVPDSAVDDFSDDDSVDRSELKKKVGMNENINSALASLANEAGRSIPVGTESIGAEEANDLLAQIGATTEGGRPLTNFEITNGLVPLFGCDDSPLPAESDLGIFQTKEEQMRSIEQRRSQEIIDKHTYPNIFGPVACPNPANGPDDSHSWNSRNVPSRKHVVPPGATGHQTSGPGIVPVLDSSPVKPKNKQGGKHSPASDIDSAADRRERSRSFDTATPSAYSTSSMSRDGMSRASSRRHRKTKSRGVTSFDANARFGWWSESEQNMAKNDVDSDESSLVQLPHIESGSPASRVATGLTPTAEFLRKENMPLSELHSATSVAGTLPFLSDRPPSFRYLQIDTEAVGFPAVGGEIEPLFCSLAIYHVEATTSSHDPRAAPVPNMQRCGRVTEVLTFDAVRDSDVETACSGCLWPYAKPSDSGSTSGQAHSPSQSTQGSRCGVFPLASNFDVAKLYAILIVHKVLSDNEDADVYTKPAKVDSKGVALPLHVDIGKLRDKAARASSRQGDFLMPFAFGVAPLLQIFGTDVPTSVNSRAVQIPLFKFTNGFGDRPIIDHIMVMLYPR